MELAELVLILESYLVDTRQIDPLARRQAALLCSGIPDAQQRTEALVVLLLTLSALRKGSPRVTPEQMLTPVDTSVINGYASLYCSGAKKEAAWAPPLTGASTAVTRAVDTVFSTPQRYAPVAGAVPATQSDPWPILVIHNGMAGFARNWNCAKRLESIHIPSMLSAAGIVSDATTVASALREVFYDRSDKQYHLRQIIAAAMACTTRFLIISGGPGTGKTSVVLQILRTMLRVAGDLHAERIVICAPTGRAKARLGESLNSGLEALAEAFPDSTSTGASLDDSLRMIHRKTLHSLLGQRPDGSFKFNREHRLPHRIIVVDEASMVDLNLFAALMEARSDECSILLVGDMYQLPSVDAGAVLGDLTGCFSETSHHATLSEKTGSWIAGVTAGIPADGTDDPSPVITGASDLKKAGRFLDHAVILTHSYRSVQTILELSHKVNRGDADGVVQFLEAEDNRDGCSLDTSEGINEVKKWLERFLQKQEIIQAYEIIADPVKAADLTRDFIASIRNVLYTSAILTLAHEGLRGRRAINTLAETAFREKHHAGGGARFFQGLPVILGRNHHALDIYNGDLGVVVQTSEGLKVAFPRGKEECKLIALDRLIDPEPAFALTVHKSQGSEFNNVLLVLPENTSPLLSRQIIYTGITRAKSHVRILGSTAILSKAVTTQEQRYGGVTV